MADVFTKGFLLGGKGWFHPSELMLRVSWRFLRVADRMIMRSLVQEHSLYIFFFFIISQLFEIQMKLPIFFTGRALFSVLEVQT